jgi:hypothetical protein
MVSLGLWSSNVWPAVKRNAAMAFCSSDHVPAASPFKVIGKFIVSQVQHIGDRRMRTVELRRPCEIDDLIPTSFIVVTTDGIDDFVGLNARPIVGDRITAIAELKFDRAEPREAKFRFCRSVEVTAADKVLEHAHVRIR